MDTFRVFELLFQGKGVLFVGLQGGEGLLYFGSFRNKGTGCNQE